MSSKWSPIPGGITVARGFKASGISAGLKSSGKPDLALLVAPKGAVCAGTFTQSLARAACVDLCIERLKVTAGRTRAVLINSGQANACTGDRGLIDSLRATQALADQLGLMPDEMLICSTGVIGVPIPIHNLLASLEHLIDSLNEGGGSDAAKAILTTDLVDKQFAFEANLGGRCVHIGGMAKGSGMIHPNMSTMLGYLTCDVGLPVDAWQSMVTRVVENSFNAVSVDGDSSTNDSLVAFAAGETLAAEYWDDLEEGLMALAQHLAKAIARDGEGANCLLEVVVKGTASAAEAQRIARTIVSSALVKTAVHGCDPNWGRILAAAGRAGVKFMPEDVCLWIGPIQLMEAGKPLRFDAHAASRYIKERMNGAYLNDDCVSICLVIGHGIWEGSAWGCDLSDQYVRINADYTT